MGLKRYAANADTTITNAYRANLTTRGTGSNMGRADSLEVFSIYAQESSGSSELSRILINFPITTFTTDRAAGALPSSGSVKFYLRMFNAVTPFTVPRNFTLVASAVSGNYPQAGGELDFSWQEGNGIDMEEYTDITRNGIGANWINMGSSSTDGVIPWGNSAAPSVGGAYYTDASSSFTQTFDVGTENLEMDITTLVEQWLDSTGNVLGSKPSYGLGVHLTASQEVFVAAVDASTDVPANTEGGRRSYYDKKFFARSSEFFYKRPMIEARWDSAKKDDRGNFYYSSSLATADENLNTLYMYNYFRGQLRNIPGLDATDQVIYVSFYSGSAGNTAPSGSRIDVHRDGIHVSDASALFVTGGVSSTAGIYTASVCLTAAATPLSTVYDVWSSALGATEYNTSSFEPSRLYLSTENPSDVFVSSVSNLKSMYKTTETSRFRVFSRKKGWNPNIYTKAVATIPPYIVESGSFAITRIIDGVEAIPYGTGSDLHTQISFDVSGSYFDLDMGMLQPGYAYKISLAYYNGSIGDWEEATTGSTKAVYAKLKELERDRFMLIMTANSANAEAYVELGNFLEKQIIKNEEKLAILMNLEVDLPEFYD